MPIRIPFLRLGTSQPRLRREYQRQIAKALKRSRFILGEEVRAFEKEFAESCGARYAVGVGSGTDALLIALRLSGIRPGLGQEVLTTPLTASFTAHAIVAAGARPVLADVDSETLLLDPTAAARRCTARSAAMVPVHLYGQCCDLPAFAALAKKAGCALIQDAAQAHGSRFAGQPLAAFSDWVAFSFYPTKNLGCLGDGGALVTNRRGLAEQARRYRDGGRCKGHTAQTEGINSRLDELQAGILRIHLRRLRAWNQRRAELAARYDRLLAERLPEGSVQRVGPAARSDSCHHLYVIRTRERDRLAAYLGQRGIETSVHYEQPLHLQPAFRRLGYRRGDFPHAERAAREVLSLPLHPFLSDGDVDRVVAGIAGFFERR